MEKKPKAKIIKAKKVTAVKDLSSIPLYNSKGKEIGRYELNKELFTGDVNKKVLYQAILMYNANKRTGSANTKTRGEISGGG
ncbi:MAG: 50S ribosomal protein L4, partial [Candidatus Omnitrophota bacterium]